MAKKKHKHRNNGGPRPRPALPRHSERKPPRKDGDPIDWGTMAATALGAAGGAVGGAFIAQKSNSPTATSVGMTVGGAAVAALTHGPARVAATGIMAAGAGQLALTLMMPRRNAGLLPEYDEADAYEPRQAALPDPALREALGRAQQSVAALYPDDDYAAHTFG